MYVTLEYTSQLLIALLMLSSAFNRISYNISEIGNYPSDIKYDDDPNSWMVKQIIIFHIYGRVIIYFKCRWLLMLNCVRLYYEWKYLSQFIYIYFSCVVKITKYNQIFSIVLPANNKII